MDRTKYHEIYLISPLFKGASLETVEYALEQSKILTLKKGEAFTADQCSLFLILEGSASVYGMSKTKPVILNTLKKGRVFGMASLFGEKCGTTSIVAKSDCTYALLSQDLVEEMLRMDIGFTKSYISFLSDKIRFLNKKIAFFTSGSTEKKVAGYILSLPLDGNKVVLDMSLSKLASALDIGRASLYRALDSLEESGFITRENHAITITSPEEFKKIYGETL